MLTILAARLSLWEWDGLRIKIAERCSGISDIPCDPDSVPTIGFHLMKPVRGLHVCRSLAISPDPLCMSDSNTKRVSAFVQIRPALSHCEHIGRRSSHCITHYISKSARVKNTSAYTLIFFRLHSLHPKLRPPAIVTDISAHKAKDYS